MGKKKILRFDRQNSLVEEEQETANKAEQKSQKRFLATVSLASQVGFSISLPIAGGAFLGQFLDNKFATSPKMTLSLIFFGLFLGVYNVYTLLREIEKDKE